MDVLENQEFLDPIKSVLELLSNWFSDENVICSVFRDISISPGMTLDQMLKTELITYALCISDIDGFISQEEVDLLNELFKLNENVEGYRSIAKTIPYDYLASVPEWVRVIALFPANNLSKEYRAEIVQNIIRSLGQVVTMWDEKIHPSELKAIEAYSDLCADYILGNIYS